MGTWVEDAAATINEASFMTMRGWSAEVVDSRTVVARWSERDGNVVAIGTEVVPGKLWIVSSAYDDAAIGGCGEGWWTTHEYGSDAAMSFLGACDGRDA